VADKKIAYPMLPVPHWWKLREKFRQSIPGVVTDTYLASTLGMEKVSARANVLPYLIDVGLIDKDGKTLDLAKKWRDDAQYAQVCAQIIEHVYPEELRSAASDPKKDRDVARRWFAGSGAGAVAVGRMLNFYFALLEADASKGKEAVSQGSSTGIKKKSNLAKPKSAKRKFETVPANSNDTPPSGGTTTRASSQPEIHINIQVHISSDATPDQINEIFRGMAEHLNMK